MNSQKGFAAAIILGIIAVVLVGVGTAAFLYITNNTNPKLESSAYTPTQDSFQIPKPDSQIGFKPPEQESTPSAATPNAQPLAPSPAPTPILPGQVETASALSTDKKSFTVDFKSDTNFQSVISISYSITYDSDAGNRGVQGTFAISGSTIAVDADGRRYIRKQIALGTCSTGGTCVYDANPKNFRLNVSTKLSGTL